MDEKLQIIIEPRFKCSCGNDNPQRFVYCSKGNYTQGVGGIKLAMDEEKTRVIGVTFQLTDHIEVQMDDVGYEIYIECDVCQANFKVSKIEYDLGGIDIEFETP